MPQGKHTPVPWTKEYDNDTGPDDESFWEWIQVGPAKVSLPRHNLKAREQAEEDAELIFAAVNSHELLVRAMEAALEHGTDSLWIENGERKSLFSICRAALAAAGKGPNGK